MLDFERFDCSKCAKNTLPSDDKAKGYINCNQDFYRVMIWRDFLCYCRSYEEVAE